MTKPDLMAELAADIRREAATAQAGQCDRLCAIAAKLQAHHAELEAVVREDAQLSDSQCDAIYQALDTYARDVDHYEFGLPWHSDEGQEKRREVIRQAMRNSAREG